MIRGIGDEMILNLFSNFEWVRNVTCLIEVVVFANIELQVGHFW